MPHKDLNARREYNRKWREKNREAIRAYSRIWLAKHRAENPEYHRRKHNAWKARHPERAYQLMRERGWQLRGINLTVSQWKDKFTEQKGRCAVCGEESYKRLVVDHNHETGQVRALLCDRCNRFVVLVVERFSHLIKPAEDYLRRYEHESNLASTESRAFNIPCLERQ